MAVAMRMTRWLLLLTIGAKDNSALRVGNRQDSGVGRMIMTMIG